MARIAGAQFVSESQYWRLSVGGLALVLTSVACLPQLAWAQSVGDKVTFERAGQKFEGVVVGVRSSGALFDVQTTAGGETRQLILAKSKITVVPSNTAGGSTRLWSDLTGKFKIEATLDSQTAFNVVLRKADGKLVTVPLDKLSIADQEYVATLDSEPVNPFAGGVASGAGSAMPNPSSGSPAASSSTGGLSLGQPQVFAKAGGLMTKPMTPPTSFSPDPSSVDMSAINTAAMEIPAVEGRVEVGKPLFISPSGTSLCYQVRSPGRTFGRDAVEPFTKIYFIDGERRRTTLAGEIKGNTIWLCSGNPTTGDVLGAVMKEGEEKASSLCVISGIRDSAPRIVAHWQMYPGKSDAADYVRYRKILDNGVCVVVYDGKVHAFDPQRQQTVWELDAPSFNEPAITPGGKYAACMTNNGCVILETQTGEQLGAFPVDLLGAVALGFSQDSTQLAVAGGTQVMVFDVASGELVYKHEANVPLGTLGKQVFWLDDNLILLPTGVLLDIDRDLILWKYDLVNDGIDYTDAEHQGLLTFTGRNQLTVVRLPHPKALSSIPSNTSNITAVQAGQPIRVVANASGPGVSPNDLQNWLKSAVTKSGYAVGGAAPTEIVASISRGKPVTKEYRSIGRGFATESVTYTPYTSKVEVKQNGKVLWQRSQTSSMPFMLNGNETLQEAAKNSEKPNPEFFKSIALPKQILKPEFQSGFGGSRVSDQGVVDTP